MRKTPSHILTVLARITLLMFAFGLLSQSVQACTLSKQHVAAAVEIGNVPCQDAGADSGCASAYQFHAGDCSLQAPVAVSNGQIPSSPMPVALAIAQQPAFPVKPLSNGGQAAPPPVNSRPRPSLSILHCSFQI